MYRRTFLALVASIFLPKDKKVEINTDSTHGNGKYVTHYFDDYKYGSILYIQYEKGTEIYYGVNVNKKYLGYKIDIQELLSKRSVWRYYTENPEFYKFPPHSFTFGNDRFDHTYDMCLTW